MGIVIFVGIIGIGVIAIGITLKEIEGWVLSIFGTILVIVAVVDCFFGASPIENATDVVVATEECKLATLDTSDCYVLRNSQGKYYFLTETENQFGKGHSAYEERWIDGDYVIIIEDETSTDGAYVRIDDYDAKMTFDSTGFKPVKAYTFVVPKGTIKFARELPECK